MILVTGANGFVGRRLIARLEALGIGQQPVAAVRDARVARMLSPAMRTVVVGEIDGTTDWSEALQGVTAVIHCAARVHQMRDAATDALAEYRRTNVQGTLNLAEQAAAAGVRRFVFLSSIKVSGERTDLGAPFLADDAVAPLDPYGISKHEAEQGLRAIAQQTPLEFTVVRPPLVYGPGVKANFAAIMHWVRQGWPLPLGAVTHNRRSFVALDNLVDLLMVCVDHPSAANQVFLVSDGNDFSTAGLIRGLALATGRPARLIPVPIWLLSLAAWLLRRGSSLCRLTDNLQVDINKTEKLLGWRPAITASEGLRRAADMP